MATAITLESLRKDSLVLLGQTGFFLSTSSGGGAGSSQIVAIDSKIEQAMDLVKTHLMLAVREEVEHLRKKIVELESSIVQLEAENSILREHVSPEVLQNLASGNLASLTPPRATSSPTSSPKVVAAQ